MAKKDANILTDGSEEWYEVKIDAVSLGTKSKSVLLLQKLLKVNGYLGANRRVLVLDSLAGDNTIFALKNFQRDKHMKITGICDSKTWKRLLGI